MTTIIRGGKRKGKTMAMIGFAFNLVAVKKYYKIEEIYSNVKLYYPDGRELEGYHYLKNADMKLFLIKIVKMEITKVLILIDEIDRLLSHRTWIRPDQLEALLGLWQDDKGYVSVFGTAHKGKSVDLLLRETVDYYVYADLDKKLNKISLTILDTDKPLTSDGRLRVIHKNMLHADLIKNLYKTRQFIS